jgi:hypothetical protein
VRHRSRARLRSRAGRRHRQRRVGQRRSARARCRRGTSPGGDEGKLALANRLGRVAQGLGHVLWFQVGIVGDDLLRAQPVGDHADDSGHRNSKTADARQTTHLVCPKVAPCDDDALTTRPPATGPERRASSSGEREKHRRTLPGLLAAPCERSIVRSHAKLRSRAATGVKRYEQAYV